MCIGKPVLSLASFSLPAKRGCRTANYMYLDYMSGAGLDRLVETGCGPVLSLGSVRRSVVIH